ncbi:hypothetical protein [Rhizobium sp. AN80A]|uniref:hypothetical protein n=1 Tax=Rhizobium sp. AN80A TaxID=3040673 RepID=UPI0024B3C869|nr:hypothetical protein [Rhizobium sp. AN80A]
MPSANATLEIFPPSPSNMSRQARFSIDNALVISDTNFMSSHPAPTGNGDMPGAVVTARALRDKLIGGGIDIAPFFHAEI